VVPEAATTAKPNSVDAVPPAQWRALFDDSPLAIAYLSPDLRLTRVNHLFAALSERTAGELLGRHCYEVLGEQGAAPQTGAEASLCSFCRAVESLRRGVVERFERPLGERVLRVVSSPMTDRGGRTQGAVLMLADATAERELQRQLLEAQKLAAIGTMTSGVAHELKNPLTSISGFAQLLRKREDLPEDAKAHIERVCGEAQRCERIVRNLLKFTRRKSEGRALVDVNSIVKESLELLRYQLSTSGIQVHEDYHPAPLPTVGEYCELQQVVHNIVSNAFDAMREANRGGKLMVRTRPEERRVVVEFENDGSELPDPDKIFLPFYTTKKAGEGTGLGLSVSESIVRKHGGTMEAKNTPDGVLFRVILPGALDTGRV